MSLILLFLFGFRTSQGDEGVRGASSPFTVFANDGRALSVHRDADPGDVDREDRPASLCERWAMTRCGSNVSVISFTSRFNAPGRSRLGSCKRIRSRIIERPIRSSVVLKSPSNAQHPARAFTQRPSIVVAGVATICASIRLNSSSVSHFDSMIELCCQYIELAAECKKNNISRACLGRIWTRQLQGSLQPRRRTPRR